MSPPRIFVSIASYRDTECQWTVKDLFEKARHPERITIGLCWQIIAAEDAACFQVSTRPEQCRVIQVDARHSRGVCWARAQVQTLWRGEEYYLQIDSHMRFAPGWDESLLAMLAGCPSPKPVLSSYPASYVPPDRIESEVVSTMFARSFDAEGLLKLHSRGVSPRDAPPQPQPSAFIAAGYLFADSRLLREVPYDPHLYFQGEEITLAVRLWTHGWDIFAPNQLLVYHDYSARADRRRHWHDHADWNRQNLLAGRRIRHLLGMEPCADPEALHELERYGLGSARSLEAYQAFSGVDFRQLTIDGKPAREGIDPTTPEERRRINTEMFTSIWRGNGWGSAESRSGEGSTLQATETLRARLPDLFAFLGIRRLADAGCGDLNWMNHLSEGLELYFGLDVVEPLMDETRKRFGRRRGHFFAAHDITVDELPPCDAVFCRDVLTHLAESSVVEALARIKASGARYLLATTHGRGENSPIRTGAWQAMDLTAPPYALPPPRLLLPEGPPGSLKALGVWGVADLP